MQIIWQIGVFQVNLQLPKLLMGVLTTLGKGAWLILQKKNKWHEQVTLSTAKKRQPIPAYTCGFMAHTGQKGAPPTPPIVFRAKEKKSSWAKTRPQRRRPLALLRRRTPLKCAASQVFLASSKPGRADAFFSFLALKTRFNCSFFKKFWNWLDWAAPPVLSLLYFPMSELCLRFIVLLIY